MIEMLESNNFCLINQVRKSITEVCSTLTGLNQEFVILLEALKELARYPLSKRGLFATLEPKRITMLCRNAKRSLVVLANHRSIYNDSIELFSVFLNRIEELLNILYSKTFIEIINFE